MILASIAMEELALSHILNAEGEKLQYIIGTLPGAHPCASPQDVLTVNKSVTSLVEAVTQNQMLLKNKLSQVLPFCAVPPPIPPDCDPGPCPPPCPPGPCGPSCPSPCKKSALQLTGQREGTLWNPGCRLLWQPRSCSGNDICWKETCPAQVFLNPERAYLVHYTLNVCIAPPAEWTGTLVLRQSPCGSFTDPLPLRVSMEHPAASQTLQYTAVLYPCSKSRSEVGLSLMLEAQKPLRVERAVMDVMAL